MPVHAVARRGFQRAAEAYERARPGYPDNALRFVFREFQLGPGKVVVDVGAGTGKLTRALLPSGAEVIAVEPVAGMRAVFRRVLPRVPLLRGTAESLPLPDGSVDLVVVGQAFHWFDARAALREFARVLRPGGGVALLWNYRDPDQLTMRVWKEAVGKYPDTIPGYRKQAHSLSFRRNGKFTRLRRRDFQRPPVLQTPRQLLERIASISWVSAMPPAKREAFLARVAETLRTDPETRGKRYLRLPYGTEVWWSFRKTGPREVSVRDYAPSDLPRLVRWHAGLYSAITRTDRRYYAPMTVAQARPEVRESLSLLRRSRGFALVGELGGRPCGFALAEVPDLPTRHYRLTRRPNLEGRINTLFVESWARRRGVGTALVRECERRLRALGCDNVGLGVVGSNAVARRLYRELGFFEFGLRLRKDVGPPPRSWAQVEARHRRARARRRPSGGPTSTPRAKGR